MPTQDRQHDIVLLGATGFTGELTAAYLAEHAPADCRWALAGRNQAKLEAVRDRLADDRPRPGRPAAAARRRHRPGVAATRWPSRRGSSSRPSAPTSSTASRSSPPARRPAPTTSTSPASRSSSTGCTSRTTTTAVATGARIVHACGFDSIPYDLGVLFTVKQLPSGVPLPIRGCGPRRRHVLRRHLPLRARPDVARARSCRRRRGAAQGRAAPRGAPRPRRRRHAGRAATRSSGYWLMPMPTIDPVVVKRSAAAREDYGPDFTYTHYAGFKTLPYAGGAAAGVLGLVAAAQVPPLRNLLLKRVPQGEGPSEAKRARSWFTVEFVGEGGGAEGPHQGQRRRPRLRRDRQDARRVGALPGLRRQPADRRAGDHGPGDGREPAGPAVQGGHFVHGRPAQVPRLAIRTSGSSAVRRRLGRARVWETRHCTCVDRHRYRRRTV